jgi:hypothetical protein
MGDGNGTGWRGAGERQAAIGRRRSADGDRQAAIRPQRDFTRLIDTLTLTVIS